MMTGLYWGKNKIRQLNIRGSKSRRRRRGDVKQGYGKLRYYREKTERKARATDV
jgi:hypothetical protein